MSENIFLSSHQCLVGWLLFLYCALRQRYELLLVSFTPCTVRTLCPLGSGRLNEFLQSASSSEEAAAEMQRFSISWMKKQHSWEKRKPARCCYREGVRVMEKNQKRTKKSGACSISCAICTAYCTWRDSQCWSSEPEGSRENNTVQWLSELQT